jgi:transcription elongation factor Elf1
VDRGGLCGYRGVDLFRSGGAMKDIDTQYTKDPICPHCGKSMSDAWELDLGDDELEYDCGHCEEPMMICRNIEITYCTRKSP